MTATFDNTLATPLDRVRRNVGDTNTALPLREDEEILAVLTMYGGDEAAATAAVASGLAVEYAQRPDSISDDGTTITWRERVKAWVGIAESNLSTSASSGGVWSEQLVRRQGEDYDPEYDRDRIWTNYGWDT